MKEDSRTGRLNAIKKILKEKEVGGQDELLRLLKREGYTSSQGTLSRDLHQLQVSKAAANSGGYIYILPDHPKYKQAIGQTLVKSKPQPFGFLSINFSRNIAVIHTRPGHAGTLAYNIDNLCLDEILGTIAGDDTIMMVLDEETGPDEVRQALSVIIPSLKEG